MARWPINAWMRMMAAIAIGLDCILIGIVVELIAISLDCVSMNVSLNPLQSAWIVYRWMSRLVIPVWQEFIFGAQKTVKKGFLRIYFFLEFSRGIFHRNVILEGVSGIPVFCHFYRIFLQEFGLRRIPPDSCSCQTLSCSSQWLQ